MHILTKNVCYDIILLIVELDYQSFYNQKNVLNDK